jgi:hypothetical protein
MSSSGTKRSKALDFAPPSPDVAETEAPVLLDYLDDGRVARVSCRSSSALRRDGPVQPSREEQAELASRTDARGGSPSGDPTTPANGCPGWPSRCEDSLDTPSDKYGLIGPVGSP